ncbi:MAG: hypothetical protein KAU02_03195 [Tenericutes bacterium]|nr:hypothetical protein [Mycoplasmatota bacterium]
MRKVFSFIVIGFIVVGFLLIYYIEEPITQVNILSIDKHYTRLITTDEETLSIPLYFSSDKSFLTEASAIDSCFFKNDYNRFQVDISEIRYGEAYYDNDQLFYLYLFDISFNSLSIDLIDIEEATFEINYLNGDTLNLSIGDIFLRFSEITTGLDIDIYRMYTVVNSTDEIDYVCGLVIGLENLSNKDIYINSIEIGSSLVMVDLGNVVTVNEPPRYNESIENILLEEYDFLKSDFDETPYLVANELIFVPFGYFETLIELKRFPIYIEYTDNNNDYEYLIDDFVFISENYSLEAYNGQLQEYIYYY